MYPVLTPHYALSQLYTVSAISTVPKEGPPKVTLFQKENGKRFHFSTNVLGKNQSAISILGSSFHLSSFSTLSSGTKKS